MNPTEPKPLEAELVEFLKSERERSDLPDAMRDRILRGVELKLGLCGGTGGGGNGPSSSNEPSGSSGSAGGAKDPISNVAGSGLTGLLGGLLLAACLGVSDEASSPAARPESTGAKGAVVASASEKHDVARPKQISLRPLVQQEPLGVIPQEPPLQDPTPFGVNAVVPRSGAASAEDSRERTGELDQALPDAGAENFSGLSRSDQLVDVVPNAPREQERLRTPRSAASQQSDTNRVTEQAAPLRFGVKQQHISPTGSCGGASISGKCPETSVLAFNGDARNTLSMGGGESNEHSAGSPVTIWSQPAVFFSADDVGTGARATGSGRSIAVDTDGNTLVAGWFAETIDLGDGAINSNGESNVFLLKLDPSGKRLWSKTFGGSGAAQAVGVAVDRDLQIVVTGWFTNEIDLGSGLVESAGGKDAFVAAFSPSGDCLWSKGFGDKNDQFGSGVQVDGEKHIAVLGAFAGTIDLGGGLLESADRKDVFVAELDSDGELLWSRRFGGGGDQVGSAIAVDSSANVVVTGAFENTLDAGGAPLVSAGGKDVFVTKLDTHGNVVWGRRFGDESDQSGLGVTVDAEGEVIVTGEFEGAMDLGSGPLVSKGGKDIFIGKLDAAWGESLWSKGFGGPANQSGLGVAVDATGNIVMSGAFEGTSDFGGGPLVSNGRSDAFVAELDGWGRHLWSERFGKVDEKNGCAVAVDKDGNLLLTSRRSGIVDLGRELLLSQGAQTIFVVKLSP